MTLSTILAAALLAATASPVPPVAPTTPVATVSTTAAGSVASGRTVSPKTRVCVRGMVTGSMIPRQLCRTYGEWLSDGTDPLNPRQVR